MNLVLPKLSGYEAIGNSVYNVIKSNITGLHLKPGDRISEKEISEILDVSRTPVREAFINLSREGLVYVLPQRGTYISRINLEHVEESRFVRESLELAVLELAVEVLTEEDLDELEMCVNEQELSLQKGSYEEMMCLDQRFHQMIFEKSNKSMSWKLIEEISTHYRMTRFLSLMGNISWSKAIEQHMKILQALKLRNADLAKLIFKQHVRNLVIDQNEIRAKYPDYFM